MKRFLLILSITMLNTYIFGQAKLDSLTIELNTLKTNSHLVGFAVGIVNNDRLIYAQGFGYANEEKKIAYSPLTIQPIASISKTLLGVALMKAQELGKLKLDDDINNYLPFKIVNPNYPDKIITIRHLANHTSGILDGETYERTYIFNSNIQPLYDNVKIEDREEIQKYIKLYNSNELMPLGTFIRKQYVAGEMWYSEEHFAKYPSGSKYKYSNMGANIAAYIIEQIFGDDYRIFVQNHILNPLNMDMSGWRSKNYQPFNEATLYWYGFPMPKSDLITYPDGNFMTNIVDFSKFLIAMIQGFNGEDNVLKHNSYIEMMQEPPSEEFKKGVFWSVDSKKIGHSGSDLGLLSHAYFFKENNIGIIVFVNTSDTSDDIIEVRDIFRASLKHAKN
ncbi:serine hydrolase domain-containing protein [Tenacibaculum sp.]|uniref:serine hydrolase domain-containing protein n=1 Tax=Tenacibaculum sp. TaxID=1906242 RepID=UPI003D14AAD7